MNRIKIAPSILSCNFLRLEEDIKKQRMPGQISFILISWTAILFPI